MWFKAVSSARDFIEQYNGQQDLGKKDSGHSKPFQKIQVILSHFNDLKSN